MPNTTKNIPKRPVSSISVKNYLNQQQEALTNKKCSHHGSIYLGPKNPHMFEAEHLRTCQKVAVERAIQPEKMMEDKKWNEDNNRNYKQFVDIKMKGELRATNSVSPGG